MPSSEKDDDADAAGYAANATQFEDWAVSAAAEGERYVCDAWTVHFDLFGGWLVRRLAHALADSHVSACRC